MQSSKKQQGEIRKPSSAINATIDRGNNRGKQLNGKEQRALQKTLEIPREHFTQRWAR